MHINILGLTLSIGEKKSSDQRPGATFVGSSGVDMRTMQNYDREGYKIVPSIYRCVSLLAQTGASLPVYAANMEGIRDEEGSVNPLLTLLAQPNLAQTKAQFLEGLITAHQLFGNAFLHGEVVGRKVKELTQLPTALMRVVEPADLRSIIPQAYVFAPDSPRDREIFDIDDLSGASEIMHWRTSNPSARFVGQSPLEAAALSGDGLVDGARWNNSLMKNAAVPTGALSAPGQLSDAQFSRLKEQMESSYAGTTNARKPMLLEGSLTWQPFGFNAVDLDFLNGKISNMRDIAQVYGVPDQVLGIPGSQTYANYSEARSSLYLDTVIPLTQGFYDLLVSWYIKITGEAPFRIIIDVDAVGALTDQRLARWPAIAASPWLTLNEKRSLTGFDLSDEEGADSLFISSAMVPLESAAEPPEMVQDPLLTGDNLTKEPGQVPEPGKALADVLRSIKSLGQVSDSTEIKQTVVSRKRRLRV